MGNASCCCSLQSRDGLPVLKQAQLQRLIKLQGLCRSYLAKKRLRETRDTKLRSLFGSTKSTPL